MKQHPSEYFGREDGYEVYYRTPKQNSDKYRFFETLDDLRAWCIRHRGKIRILFGSWQAFHFLEGGTAH